MLYDRHLMQPLLQLKIGNPGSSFAIEIARKIGLPESIISEATEIIDSGSPILRAILCEINFWEIVKMFSFCYKFETFELKLKYMYSLYVKRNALFYPSKSTFFIKRSYLYNLME